MTESPKTRFISFYSYKGGVGRTLALANCARSMAKQGKTVAILDLDLEAPGLEHFAAFRPQGEMTPGKDGTRPSLRGFAEYLHDCRLDGPPKSLAGYFHPCQGMAGDKGRVFLMPAGKRDGAPYRNVLSLDWDRFYQDEDGYRILENLRGHIAHDLGGDERRSIRPDYVLIDARTGLSETGGIATHQLSDLVVLLFGLNHQNLEGTTWIHDSLSNLPEPPLMLLVISPLPEIMETGKGTLFAERLAYIQKHLHKATNHKRPATLPYRPVLTWEERILVDSEEAEYLGYEQPYHDLLTSILTTLQAPEIFLDRAMHAWRANDEEQAQRELDAGLAANPEDPALLEALARLGADRRPTPTLQRGNVEQALRIDLARLPVGAAHFLGRGPELAALDAAWADGSGTSVVELVAPSGTGKTALVKHWLEGLAARDWEGATRVFAWSFSQGDSSECQANEDHFLAEALKWFAVDIDPAINPAGKGHRLAEALAERSTLLILDGVESMQYPPGPLAGQLRASGLAAMLDYLVDAGRPGLCVLTSRERLANFARRQDHPGGSVLCLKIENLDDTNGARLLHILGVNRAGSSSIAADDIELVAASREVQGHGLTLSLLGNYLRLAHQGDIRCRNQVELHGADEETQKGQTSRIISAYERWLSKTGEAGVQELAALRLLGLFDRPASPEDLAALRAPPPIPGLTEAFFDPSGTGSAPQRARPDPMPTSQWRIVLERLGEASFIAPIGADGSVDTHPLTRKHLATVLRETRPDAWREGHRRLYELLKNSAPHRPEGMDGLIPLYQAVAHGCYARLWQEVLQKIYIDRILRGIGADGFYSSRKLGAYGANLGALACFFAEPWTRPSPALDERTQSWLLGETASQLRALGRLGEALGPMRIAAEMARNQEDWKSAARYDGNLSQLRLTLGRIAEAAQDAQRSAEYLKGGSDVFQRILNLVNLADALFQGGKIQEAMRYFAEAEAMQAEVQPQFPILYSTRGFMYCDLLLAGVERAAWREGAAGLTWNRDEVERRAKQTLQWAETDESHSDIALDHLTLARCALYAGCLQGTPPDRKAQQITERALEGLRTVGNQIHLPRALLTRAWLRHALGDPDAARADLDEAHRIAARGGMALHLADIALTRARLFHDRAALAEARRLIEECGYGRRLPELQDAESAAVNWPD